ncbi:hypothetical protein Tco_1424737 [Tanacetum coccineum]
MDRVESYRNPHNQGNSESWFDTPEGIDSEGDEDFYSTQDAEGELAIPNTQDENLYVSCYKLSTRSHALAVALGVFRIDNISQNGSISSSVTPRLSDHVSGAALSSVSNSLRRPSEVKQSSIDGASTVYDDGSHNLGIQQNNCLPCLTCVASTDVNNNKSQCSSPPSAKKKVTSMLSFKWRENPSNISIRKTHTRQK